MPTAADIMTTNITTLHATDTLADAARLMRNHDIGALPVVDDNDHLIGILTDRDLVIHGIAPGLDPTTTPVDVIGLQSVATITHESDFDSIHTLMTTRQVRRLPVVDNDGRLVGVIGLADIAQHTDPATLGAITEQLTH